MSGNSLKKFRCVRCGQCCSHIRGMMSEEEKAFLTEFAYGKLPLVQLFPIERMSFPLFDFEARRFKEWQKEVNIDAKIKPSRVIFDLNTNSTIVVTYYMDFDSCPFLKDDSCLIYDKKRAFICRLFPFNKGPFLKTGEALKVEDMFGSCPSLKEIVLNLKQDNLVNQLIGSFGDDFLNIVEYDYLAEWVNRTIVSLTKEKRIKPAMGYPYKYLLKRIDASQKIDFLDFLIKEGIKTVL